MNKLRLIIIFILLCLFTLLLSYYHYVTFELNVFKTSKLISAFDKSSKVRFSWGNSKYYLVKFSAYTIYLFFKILTITSLLYLRLTLINFVSNVRKLFFLVLKAEFIFLLPLVFEIFYFTFINKNFNKLDIQNFFPLSAINISGYEGLEPWYIYPLQTLNLFEIAYIIYLGFQVAKLTHSKPDEGLKIVVLSYVPALLLWVSTIMFLTLSYS